MGRDALVQRYGGWLEELSLSTGVGGDGLVAQDGGVWKWGVGISCPSRDNDANAEELKRRIAG